MERDSRYFGQVAVEKRIATDPILCAIAEHPAFATCDLQSSDAAESPTSEKRPNNEHEKFGVEEYALYDFRDYGLD